MPSGKFIGFQHVCNSTQGRDGCFACSSFGEGFVYCTVVFVRVQLAVDGARFATRRLAIARQIDTIVRVIDPDLELPQDGLGLFGELRASCCDVMGRSSEWAPH